MLEAVAVAADAACLLAFYISTNSQRWDHRRGLSSTFPSFCFPFHPLSSLLQLVIPFEVDRFSNANQKLERYTLIK